MRPETEHKYNSPWNIAAEFKVDMSFSVSQIEMMLEEYESEHHTGMDMSRAAEEIYQYTSGYPYLVSVICKSLYDLLLKRNLTLFDSMARQLDRYPDLKEMLEDILYRGKRIIFSLGEKSINLEVMFGFLKEQDGGVAISNRIFLKR